ncbi:MAG: AmmeMemoRadiSam system protein B, partial [Steroidobacteraceae bacterium]|nr:AmmeMemoRadiSam system protein B [Steroidobacteraceae bacterium]
MLRLDKDKSRIRPPAVAGLFYPENANELRHDVNGYVAECSPHAAVAGCPKALIVPHAGYQYSGPVAGFAYRRLRDRSASIRHVVMIGPSHRVPIRGLAVPSVDSFATPLGQVPVDVAGRERLLELGLVGISDAAHAAEHSLEVQLPFLQVVLEDFDILPITVGFAPAELVARVIDAVWGGPDTLVLVSSDLSHYHTWSEARQLDAETTRAIVERRSDLPDEQACGACGINGLMQVARRRGLAVEVLDHRNSGDTAGDRSRVV